MITFHAAYFYGRSSTAHPVTITADEQRLRIQRSITRDMKNFPGESLLSSHPLTEERIRNMRDFEKGVSRRR